jgi:hypothetical protein|tara:strand:- start:474 stop:809 length:336 start_codon:yes stop_codon:yes gene_type:complete
MKYFLSLLLIVPLIGQVTLSQEEMLGIANNIKELEHSDSSKSVQIFIYEDLVKEMENQIKADSLILLKKDEQIGLLKERDETNEQIIDLVEPKWYEHRYLWLVIGFIVGKI